MTRRHSPRWPALAACCVALATPSLAGNYPPGFVEEIYVEVPLPENLATFAWTPGGQLFLGDKYGQIYYHDPVANGGSTSAAKLRFLQVDAEGERGVNGMAVDPLWDTNSRLWIYYTAPDPPRNRVSHFTFAGGKLIDEQVVLEGPPVQDINHNAGCLRFASDKTLYIAMGEDNQGSITAQDPFDLRGKILRIQRDGSGAPGNPFLDGGGGDPRVWAMGLRNPFRFSVQPETDAVLVGDVGAFTWEELTWATAGANLGWAMTEGPEPPDVAGLVYPAYTYNHDGAGAAIIAGDFARGDAFSAAYEGHYFFADFVKGEIYRIEFEEDGHVRQAEIFATDVDGITELLFGPDGAMYYVCRTCTPHSVKRVSYIGGDNKQPVAVASVVPDSGSAPLEVVLDGSASHDEDGDDLGYDWDLGNGEHAAEPVAGATYPSGVYDVRLEVDDGRGGVAVTPSIRIVSGNHRPSVEIDQPADGLRYSAGNEITYSGSAMDTEDGPLSCSAFRWEMVFHHAEHTHPFLGPLEGICGGSFSIPARGETSPDVRYSVHMWASDSGDPVGSEGSLEGHHVVELLPNTANMELHTEPLEDLLVELDTVPLRAPQTVEGVVGVLRRIGARTQEHQGRTWRWLGWSDGGLQHHEIPTPASDTTFVATFGCNVLEEVTDLRLEKVGSGPEVRLTWTPSSDACVPSVDSSVPPYRVYAAPTARPANGTGRFPADPFFSWIASPTLPTLLHEPPPGAVFYLVTTTGSDLDAGPIGHYGR